MAKRLTDLDVMQGIAMTLVVLGHHKLSFMPEWYMYLFRYIYTFHMPLFIFISGFLIRYSYKKVNSFKEYKLYIRKKAKKFIPPYIIIGIICTLLTCNFTDVNFLITNLTNLLISPKESEATFLWYIYLLFIFYCIAPIIFETKTWIKKTLFILALLFSLNRINIPYFNIDYFTRYFIFFLSGALAVKYYDQIRSINKCFWNFTLIIFILASIIYFMFGKYYLLKYIMQWISIPTFYYIAQILTKFKIVSKTFVFVSINCFGIYLLHLFFIQVSAIIISRLSYNIPSWGYIIYLIASTIMSIYTTAWIWNKFSAKRTENSTNKKKALE